MHDAGVSRVIAIPSSPLAAAPAAVAVIVVAIAIAGAGGGCSTTETNRRLETATVVTRGTPYSGPTHRVVIGKYENRSPYMRGIFSDGVDRLGMQAEQILKTHLSQTGRFVLMDRTNMQELKTESGYSGTAQQITGGDLVITGAVTEFGRKEVGSSGSIFGRTRHQVAHCKVQLSVVDVRTSQVVFSEQGAGEYDLGSGDVLGFGSAASYDATLNDKVLNLATIEVVDKLVAAMEGGQWGKPQ
jgi:curli biogenesis system outer membrane secretion channel CsgG